MLAKMAGGGKLHVGLRHVASIKRDKFSACGVEWEPRSALDVARILERGTLIAYRLPWNHINGGGS